MHALPDAPSRRRASSTGTRGTMANDPGMAVPRAEIHDDARPTRADIPPNVLVHLVQYAAARAIDCTGWFAGLGLERAQIADPGLRVSYREAALIIRRALEAIAEPGVGLRIGRHETLGSFGLLGLAMMTSRTFGEAMRTGIEHHKVCGSLLDVTFEIVDERTVALAASPRFGEAALLPFLAEELFASSLAIGRELAGPALRPLRVELTYAAPAHAADYAEVFRCEVRFGARANRVLIDADWLQHPLPGHNPLVSRQALALCRQQLSRDGLAHGETVAAVERLLRSRLGEHPRIEEIARTLNLSERSLRRRLAESGRVFREIHDRVRAERALELLQAGVLSIADVGSEIGFQDPREFRRAFKRWTGMPPQAARGMAAASRPGRAVEAPAAHPHA
jgi:AraC-like DNA-binding protein